jgi:hypothetical protein
MTKSGYKTTEFWLAIAATMLAALAASGVIAGDSGLAKVIAILSAALASMGYSGSRAFAKGSTDKANAILAASGARPPVDPSLA